MTDVMSKTVKAVLIVIGVVILMSAAAVLLPALNATGLNASDLCTNNGCFYNSSRSADCTPDNTTSDDTATCLNPGAIMPLGGLVNSNGVVPLVFGAVIVILSILGLLLIFKKKSGA